MSENDLAKQVVDCCYKIHIALGPGLLESVYERVLMHELRKRQIACENQVPVPVIYDGLTFDIAFIADIIVSNKIIIELKSVETVKPVHKKQLLTYLKLTGLKLGLLVNFNETRIKDGITRVVNGL